MGDRREILRVAFSGEQYVRLKQHAIRLMARERLNHTLGATALLNELWIKLQSGHEELPDPNGDYFIEVAIQRLKWILISHGKRRRRPKRWSGKELESLDAFDRIDPSDWSDTRLSDFTIDLRNSLDRIGTTQDPRIKQVMSLHLLDLLSISRISSLLGITEWNVREDMKLGNNQLRHDLRHYWNVARVEDGEE